MLVAVGSGVGVLVAVGSGVGVLVTVAVGRLVFVSTTASVSAVPAQPHKNNIMQAAIVIYFNFILLKLPFLYTS